MHDRIRTQDSVRLHGTTLTLSHTLSSLSSADGQLGAQTLLRASAHSAESVCAKSAQSSLCIDNLRKSAQTLLSIYAHSAQSLCAHSAQSLSVSSLSLDIEILVSKILCAESICARSAQTLCANFAQSICALCALCSESLEHPTLRRVSAQTWQKLCAKFAQKQDRFCGT